MFTKVNEIEGFDISAIRYVNCNVIDGKKLRCITQAARYSFYLFEDKILRYDNQNKQWAVDSGIVETITV